MRCDVNRKLQIVWFELSEAASMASTAITAHKLRSALTLLGVMVGVFSIIVVITAMRVLQDTIEADLSQLGRNTFQIRKWPGAFFGVTDFGKFWRRKNITLEQGEKLKDSATLALNVGLECSFWGGTAISRFDKTPPTVGMMGETAGSFPAHNWIVEEGRALLDSDVDSARNVCVLGAGLAKILFPFGSALGDTIKLDGLNYTVIGVLQARGLQQGSDQDNFAVIPITTGLNRYGRTRFSLSIMVQSADSASYPDALEQARGLFRTVRKVPPADEDDFEVFSNDSLIQQFKTFTFAVRAGVAVISSIALLAAGVGIMNIMLVSVTERTREIGIRRAVGAKKRNIMTQFILEAVVLCEVGGVIGVVLGILGGNSTAFFLELRPVIPFDWAAYGLLICSAVGIIFGTYPAYKAANLDPIDSLRYE